MYRLSVVMLFCLVLFLGCHENKKELSPAQNEKTSESKASNEQIIDYLKITNEDWTIVLKQAEAIINNKGLLTMIFNHINIIDQDLDYALVNKLDMLGAHGVIRVKGYSIKDIGAANKEEDSLVFMITELSPEVKNFLLNKRNEKFENNIIKINLAVPHIYDPEHVVRNSTIDNEVFVIINVEGDFNRGGWDNTYKIMMFQKEQELNKPFLDNYTQADYDSFYDGI